MSTRPSQDANGRPIDYEDESEFDDIESSDEESQSDDDGSGAASAAAGVPPKRGATGKPPSARPGKKPKK